MDHLPLNDVPMLVSTINFLLRDNEFDNLDEICDAFGVSRQQIDSILASGGFAYSEQLNKVR